MPTWIVTVSYFSNKPTTVGVYQVLAPDQPRAVAHGIDAARRREGIRPNVQLTGKAIQAAWPPVPR